MVRIIPWVTRQTACVVSSAQLESSLGGTRVLYRVYIVRLNDVDLESCVMFLHVRKRHRIDSCSWGVVEVTSPRVVRACRILWYGRILARIAAAVQSGGLGKIWVAARGIEDRTKLLYMVPFLAWASIARPLVSPLNTCDWFLQKQYEFQTRDPNALGTNWARETASLAQVARFP